MSQFVEYLMDALIDSAKMLPFLYIIYLLMEVFEHRAGKSFPKILGRTSKLGPFAGGLIGAVPQCGLAAASASLYSGRIITAGTLLAVFLSSSDEMLPILISEGAPVLSIIKIVATKVAIGIVSGYAADIILRKGRDESNLKEAEDSFRGFDCHCNVFLAALKRTIEIFIYIFVFSLVLNSLIGAVGEDRLASVLNGVPVIGEFIAGLVGLIPNCASSVAITQLYLSGIIGPGPLFAGLLVNAGVGTLVLVRENRNARQNVAFILALYCIGVVWGIAIELLGIVF